VFTDRSSSSCLASSLCLACVLCSQRNQIHHLPSRNKNKCHTKRKEKRSGDYLEDSRVFFSLLSGPASRVPTVQIFFKPVTCPTRPVWNKSNLDPQKKDTKKLTRVGWIQAGEFLPTLFWGWREPPHGQGVAYQPPPQRPDLVGGWLASHPSAKGWLAGHPT
jgi:hypothetical protein